MQTTHRAPHIRPRIAPLGRVMLIALVFVLAGILAGGARGADAHDLAGTWECCGAGGAATQNFVITSGGSSLTGSGELPGGQVFSSITGSVAGDAVTIVTTYNSFSPGYVATFVGTLSPDQTTITGSWTSNVRQAGTFTATRRLEGVAVSGSVTQEKCDETACRRTALPGVRVSASGGPGGATSATTGADGKYTIRVKKGEWTFTPSLRGYRFTPPSREAKVTGDRSGVDFATCARGGEPSAGAQLAQQKAVVCDPDGLDWTMPARFGEQVLEWDSNPNNFGIIQRRTVYPKDWRVSLFVTQNGRPVGSCPRGVTYRWTVDPPAGAKVSAKIADGCRTSMRVSDLGNYRVKATRMEKGKTDGSIKQTVIVKDWLIVGMGDSNGSGEGNGPFPIARCNRSTLSYQYLTAEYVEKQDPRSSVTFVFTSCSGATIEQLFDQTYGGINPQSPALPPQIDQINEVIETLAGSNDPKRQRKVDAAIISVGVNNLAFGPLLAFCVKAKVTPGHLNPAALIAIGCEQFLVKADRDARGKIEAFTRTRQTIGFRTLRDEILDLQRGLVSKYPPLARALAAPIGARNGGLGIRDPKRVFLSQYPDFMTGDDRQPCETYESLPPTAFAGWPRATWAFLQSDGANRLNANVARAAANNNWNLGVIDQATFIGHGYCASDSYFTTVAGGIAKINVAGAFHPNARGHTINAQLTEGLVCTKLYGEPSCTARLKP